MVFMLTEGQEALAVHLRLVDDVNNAKTELERRLAESLLRGYRDGLRAVGVQPDMAACDMHALPNLCDDGVDPDSLRPVCCGVFLDWEPEAGQ